MNEKIKEYSLLLGVSIEDLQKSNRCENIVDKKHVIWYTLRNEGYTTVEIAKYFNMNTHASVVMACSRIINLIDIKDRKILYLLELLTCQ